MLSKRALIVRDAQKKFEHSKHANQPRKREKKQEQKRVDKITDKPFEGKSN